MPAAKCCDAASIRFDGGDISAQALPAPNRPRIGHGLGYQLGHESATHAYGQQDARERRVSAAMFVPLAPSPCELAPVRVLRIRRRRFHSAPSQGRSRFGRKAPRVDLRCRES
jgi:hypothetical protein